MISISHAPSDCLAMTQFSRPLRLGMGVPFGKYGSGHLPIHIHGGQMRSEESNAADLRGLMAVLEQSREDTRMKSFYVGSAVRMDPRDIREVGVFGEGHGKCVGVMLVPGVEEALESVLDGGSVFCVGVSGLGLIHCGPP